MADTDENRALLCSCEGNFTPLVKTCERPSGYKISSAYYMGAMGLSMPTRSANQGQPREEQRTRRRGEARKAEESTDTMVQLELSFSEVPDGQSQE